MSSTSITYSSSSTPRTQFPISRAREHQNYVAPLHQVTLFPYANRHIRPSLEKAIRSFRFRSIEFAKKRSLPFFLAVELLTQQKGIASLSQRNVLKRKIRKGRRVGCRVTLRRGSLRSFIDSLGISLPRIEIIPGAKTSSGERGSSQGQGDRAAPTTPRWTSRRDILRSRERERRRRENVREKEGRTWAAEGFRRLGARVRRSTASDSFTLGELLLFYPFERGLGLHPDVTRMNLTLRSSTRVGEERYYLLRSYKLPVV